ncbi:MAG: GIY-YIG nuclease family protein [Zavarzinella sp.]
MAKRKEQVTDEDLELLGDLGVETDLEETDSLTAVEQRIIAGFQEIERFVEEQGRLPEYADGRDIFEKLYAVRLEKIRNTPDCLKVLQGQDRLGLLTGYEAAEISPPTPDEDLLADLGVDESENELEKLVHVRSREEINAAENIAQRNPCKDFDIFKPLFKFVQEQLASGQRETIPFRDNARVNVGDMFILDGLIVYVAEKGELFTNEHGHRDARLRVIFSNGTESDMLLRSLQRALNKDNTSRRIRETDHGGPLFSSESESDDEETGSIYVLRSNSVDPVIQQNRESIHKIGVTRRNVRTRISNAKKNTTYLLADVECVAEYRLANMEPEGLEDLLHRFFANARLDIAIKDRFGADVEPKEWYLVPLTAIDDAIEKIRSGTIEKYHYDLATASVVKNV